jgi:hypothetical protein
MLGTLETFEKTVWYSGAIGTKLAHSRVEMIGIYLYVYGPLPGQG